MRKILLASCAALILASGSAAAQEMQVRVGGSVDVQGGHVGGDRVNDIKRDLRNETELFVQADGKADNGIGYGARIELNNGAANTIGTDEVYGYVTGGFGRVEFGDAEGVSERLRVAAPSFGIGQIDGDYVEFLGGAAIQPWGGPLGAPGTGASTKLSYFTPSLHGATVGLSYTPTDGDTGNSVARNAFGYNDVVEIGGNYSRDVQGVGVIVGGTLTTAKGEALRDYTGWQVGAQAKYRGLTVGGGYADAGSYGILKSDVKGGQNAWNLGAAYDLGQFTVGASYLNGKGYNGFGSAGFYHADYDAYAVGVTYKLLPGVALSSDIVHVRADVKADPSAAATGENAATVFIVGTKVAF